MSAKTPSDGSSDDRVPFGCDWRSEGLAAASVRVSGELDLATAPLLERKLRDALGSARLVLLNMSEVTFMECTGLHVIVRVSRHAREKGGRLVLVGISRAADALLAMTGAVDHVTVLRTGTADEPPGAARVRMSRGPGRSPEVPAALDVERWIRPLDNPVNAIVLTARVTEIPDGWLRFQCSDGVVRRAWAPAVTRSAVPVGTPIEVYLDDGGEVNGWFDPGSRVAVNQRRLETVASPEPDSALACRGRCGVVWRAPAAAELSQRDEYCLTCAGPLVPA